MDVYTAISQPNRRLILEQLAVKGQLSAQEIANEFQITVAAISQHLKVLFEAGLVKKKKLAQKRIYSLNEDGLAALEEWIQQLKTTWESRFENLDTVLQKSK